MKDKWKLDSGISFVALVCVTVLSPVWIPFVMGGVPCKPVISESPLPAFRLKSPWDRVHFGRDSGDEFPLHAGFPTTVDSRAFRTSGGAPNVRSLVRPGFAALAKVTSASDAALACGDRAAANRVLEALDFWAKADAFHGSPRIYRDMEAYGEDPPLCELTGEPWNITPPEPVRGWSDDFIQLGPNGYGEPFFLGKMATGAAVAFLQVRPALSPQSEEVRRVKSWFRGDLMQFQKDFAILCFHSRQITDHAGHRLPSRRMMLWGWEGAHNKVFCSLLAVTALAIAADDEASFQWAMEAFDFALNQIEDDGTHRATLYEKGSKALLYHNFIADTIVPLAVLADANGYSFLSDPRLTKLIRRVASSLDEPSHFESVTGLPQEHGSFHLAGTSGWTVIYSSYVADPVVAKLASPNRVVFPLFAGSGRRYGGHPMFWNPSAVSPVAVWIGQSIFYACALCLALAASALSVVIWKRGRIPKGSRFRVIAAPALVLATLITTGIGFGWTYLLLRVI